MVYYIDETLNNQKQTYDITPDCKVHMVFSVSGKFKFRLETSQHLFEFCASDSSTRHVWIIELEKQIKLSRKVIVASIKSSLSEQPRYESLSDQRVILTDTFNGKSIK